MTTASKMLSKKAAVTEDQVGESVIDSTKKVTAEKAPVKKAPVKKASAKKAQAKEVDFIVETSHICEGLAQDEALELAEKLANDIEFNYFRLGGVMSVMQANSFWSGAVSETGVPYESFRDLIESRYGMPYRKGMYLVSIYNNLVESGVLWNDVKDIGWTKLKEISGLINPENVAEWRERAMSMTTIQLIEYIKELEKAPAQESEAGVETPSISTMTFKVHADQKETIETALAKAMSATGTEFKTVALESICMAYIEGSLGKKKVQKKVTLEEVIADMSVVDVFEAVDKCFPGYDITVVEK